MAVLKILNSYDVLLDLMLWQGGAHFQIGLSIIQLARQIASSHGHILLT